MSAPAVRGTSRKQNLCPIGVPVLDGMPTPPGIRAGPFIFISGRNASDWLNGLAPEARVDSQLPYTGELPTTLQTKYIYKNVLKVFEAGGSSIQNAVRVNQWIPTYHGRHDAGNRETPQDPDPYVHHEEWREAADPYLNARNLFITEKRPASMMLPVDRLLCLPAQIEIDMVGITNDSGWTKEEISTNKVPAPLAGYSEAIVVGPWIFLSGFSATDFTTGLPPSTQPAPWNWYGDKLELETDYVLNYLRVVLEESGGRWEDVVKVQVYLNTPDAVRHYPALEKVWRKQFPTNPPARTVIQSNGNGLTGCWLEIDIIGIKPGMGISKEAVETPKAPRPLGHAPQAIRAGPLLFLSTGLPLTTGGQLVKRVNQELPFTSDAIRAQTEQILTNAGAICQEVGGDVTDLVRSHVLFSDLRDFPQAMQVWKAIFGDQPPAATFVEVPPIGLVPGARITMDLWAYIA
jgi:enamine deaminase RidA (YjgF/YER057c/UK114 family)